ncbi:MAG: hypothetical protein QM755_17710 [Luteolibacter sp.]
MSKGKVIGGIVAVTMVVVMVWKWRASQEAGIPSLAGTESARKAESPPAPESTPVITVLPIAADMATLNSPETQPQDDLSALSMLLTTYGRQQGGNPTGENEEITATLLGNNPKHAAYLPAKAPFVNAAGQLIDRWGTPYFFHSMTSNRTDIRSAGPDRELWTADDLVSSP